MKGTHPIISLSQVFILGLFSFLVVATCVPLPSAERGRAAEPPRDPILRLETGMHTAMITEIDVDADNRFLVTGADDKTVRVWELPQGRLIQTLRPPIGKGHEGKIYAVAISPDGKTIAAAGYTCWKWEGGASIYLFDRESGRMTRPRGLQGLLNVVYHLAYSKNGRFLAATLARGNGIRIYRTSDYTLVKEDTEYGGDSYGADFSRDGRLVTASYDGFVRLYDKNFTLIKKVQVPGGKQPSFVSFSPHGTKIAVGFLDTPQVDILSGKDLSHLPSPDTSDLDNRNLAAVSWSSDGSLYAGGTYARGDIFPILKWAEGGKGRYRELPASGDSIMHIVPLKDGAIAFGAADPTFGIFDRDGNRTLYRDSQIADFRDNRAGFLVSSDGAAVQFGVERWGKSPARFSIANRLLALDPSEPGTLKPPVIEAEGLKITGLEQYTSQPKLNEKPLKLDEYEWSRSLAVCPDEQCFLLGTEWYLRLFDRGGVEKWPKPIAIPGVAWSVNIAADGKVAVASLGDGTIRWYRMKDGEELLALFPHKDRKRWVLWTPKGYYDASPGGEDLIGWHVNRGPDQAADFFEISRFRSSYYRPDVIEKVLKTLDANEAVKLANVKAGVKERARAVQEILPPVVQIISPADNSQVKTKTLTIRYSVRSPAGDPVTGIRAFVDGGLSKEERGLNLVGAEIAREIEVSVPGKDCEIGIVAQNRHGWGQPVGKQIKWKGPEDEEKGMLYVLAIGVSNYEDDMLKKGVTNAAEDARKFGEFFKERKKRGGLYRDIQVKIFLNEKATKDDIDLLLTKISKDSSQYNVLVLFLSGHGEQDRLSNEYRFLLFDADKERRKSKYISLSDIRDWVKGFTGKRVVFIDSCRSGLTIDNTGLANVLGSVENGLSVFNSASGGQNSIEVEGSGLFTKVLLEGLKSPRAANPEGNVTTSRLKVFVEEEFDKITKGKRIEFDRDSKGKPIVQTPAIICTGTLELAEVTN